MTRTLKLQCAVVVVAALCVHATVASSEEYTEDLLLRPLRDGKVASTFTFTTLLHSSPDDAQHYTLFPLALGQILRAHAVTELHLSLNAGKWDYRQWHYPDHPAVATGAELWAWMPGTGADIDARWAGLRNSLAGLFCASLGSLDQRRTLAPTDAYQPLGDLPVFQYDTANGTTTSTTHHLRHATLPSENVCTENLTPFLKLLPCKDGASTHACSLARLLNPQRLFDADWHGMGVHVRWLGGGEHSEGTIELKLVVQAVLDPVRTSGGRRDWSLTSLFDRVLDGTCPVAGSSTVRVVLPSEDSGGMYRLSPEAETGDAQHPEVEAHARPTPLDVSMAWHTERVFEYPEYGYHGGDGNEYAHAPPTIHRFLHHTAQTHGVLTLSITNPARDALLRVGYLETLPALVVPWVSTLSAEVVSGKDGGMDGRGEYISDLVYHPSRALSPPPSSPPSSFWPSLASLTPSTSTLHSPSLLQATLTVPPNSTLRVQLALSKAFLRYTEHPPDAMRGWDLPGGVLFPRIHTPALLTDLPTPDFSMPYNVIILSCTLLTLVFGSVFNAVTRGWGIVDLSGGGEDNNSGSGVGGDKEMKDGEEEPKGGEERVIKGGDGEGEGGKGRGM
ncbi:GPI transamidase component PIG-T [Hygrophoropsis aurantiaca]|uniref:GPI transamidase component PIG-T n=1 Tax=Hygrophoropsis aurantiaca TaxID=72124 RepID=A0ACB8A6L4_9AGAM|nr:GPI transamidase component PIG-T [Hygrophoropsis aurantiaca]